MDASGYYVAPSLLGTHIHIESTLFRPSEYVRTALAHGTTDVFADLRETVNVLGIRGINIFLKNSESYLSEYLSRPPHRYHLLRDVKAPEER